MDDQPTNVTILAAAGTVIAVTLGALGALWAVMRRERRKDQRVSVELQREKNEVDNLSTNDTLKHMRAVMKQRTEFYEADRLEARRRHDTDMADVNRRMALLDEEVRTLRQENIKCREEAARRDEHSKHQDEHLKNQDQEIQRLRHKIADLENKQGYAEALIKKTGGS